MAAQPYNQVAPTRNRCARESRPKRAFDSGVAAAEGHCNPARILSLDLLDTAKPFLTQHEKKNLLIHMDWLKKNLAQLIDRLNKLPTTD